MVSPYIREATPLSTNIYIDGFNLYNGSLKGTQYRWLDLQAMCQMLLPGPDIHLIRYFTARVIGFDHDPGAPQRQDLYLRALGTLPLVRIHADAFFATHPVLLPQFPLAYRDRGKPPRRPPQMVQVERIEEKLTDVDIAVQLLLDCFNNASEEYVIISNDSDLVPAALAVRDIFHKPIGVINPHGKQHRGGHLAKAASYHIRSINNSVLQQCQLAPEITDAKGTFSKPPSW